MSLIPVGYERLTYRFAIHVTGTQMGLRYCKLVTLQQSFLALPASQLKAAAISREAIDGMAAGGSWHAGPDGLRQPTDFVIPLSLEVP